MVLGLLLARSGVQVTVLEKHGDFLRDFRGDTVHPSTLSLLDELGLGDRFAALPQRRVNTPPLPTGPRRPPPTLRDPGVLRPPHNTISMAPPGTPPNPLPHPPPPPPTSHPPPH